LHLREKYLHKSALTLLKDLRIKIEPLSLSLNFYYSANIFVVSNTQESSTVKRISNKVSDLHILQCVPINSFGFGQMH